MKGRARTRPHPAIDVPWVDPETAANWETDLACAEVAIGMLLRRSLETRQEDYWVEHYLWHIHRDRLLELKRKIAAVTL